MLTENKSVSEEATDAEANDDIYHYNEEDDTYQDYLDNKYKQVWQKLNSIVIPSRISSL